QVVQVHILDLEQVTARLYAEESVLAISTRNLGCNNDAITDKREVCIWNGNSVVAFHLVNLTRDTSRIVASDQYGNDSLVTVCRVRCLTNLIGDSVFTFWSTGRHTYYACSCVQNRNQVRRSTGRSYDCYCNLLYLCGTITQRIVTKHIYQI